MGEKVAGMCPACRTHSLALGAGGRVTCGLYNCPDPGLLDRVLNDHGLLGILRQIEGRGQEAGDA